jgi:hypothetical protein
MLVIGTVMACASITVIRFTQDTFQPKASGQEVQVLFQEPSCPHLKLAALSGEETTWSSLEDVRLEILRKAAQLGADAVIILDRTDQINRYLKYQQDSTVIRPSIGWAFSSYPGWGYGAFGSRFGGLGAGGGAEEIGAGRPASGFGAAGFTPVVSGIGRGMGVATPYEVSVTSLHGIAVRFMSATARTC